MALSGSAPRRYAEALLDLAEAEGAIAPYRASFEALAAGLGPAALRALRDPSVPMRQRVEGIARAAEGQPSAIRSLLRLLVERGRIGLLPDISRAFGDLVDRRAGIAKARITTAVALDARQQTAFIERLERASRKQLRATFAVDPSLIGGAKVQVGDHLIDTSVRAQLSALRSRMTGS
jgi:F-type H+-transporting ATPase subunit delta